MTILTVAEKRQVRNFIEQKAHDTGIPVSWIKAAANDAAQAVEDLIDGTEIILDSEIPGGGKSFKVLASERIDTATIIPHSVTFTNAEKKWIGAKVFELKFVKDKV